MLAMWHSCRFSTEEGGCRLCRSPIRITSVRAPAARVGARAYIGCDCRLRPLASWCPSWRYGLRTSRDRADTVHANNLALKSRACRCGGVHTHSRRSSRQTSMLAFNTIGDVDNVRFPWAGEREDRIGVGEPPARYRSRSLGRDDRAQYHPLHRNTGRRHRSDSLNRHDSSRSQSHCRCVRLRTDGSTTVPVLRVWNSIRKVQA